MTRSGDNYIEIVDTLRQRGLVDGDITSGDVIEILWRYAEPYFELIQHRAAYDDKVNDTQYEPIPEFMEKLTRLALKLQFELSDWVAEVADKYYPDFERIYDELTDEIE